VTVVDRPALGAFPAGGSATDPTAAHLARSSHRRCRLGRGLSHALREVRAPSIHGVDRTVAVELTKVALWIETVEQASSLSERQHPLATHYSGVFDPRAAAGASDAAYSCSPATTRNGQVFRQTATRRRAASRFRSSPAAARVTVGSAAGR